MSYLRRDTLAYHKSRPFLSKQVARDLPLVQVVNAMNSYMEAESGLVSVEESALKFYLLNQAFAELQAKFGLHEPLPIQYQVIATTYVAAASAIAVRAMYYVLIICARESRHLHKQEGFKKKLHKQYGSAFFDWQMALPDSPHEAVKYFRNNPPPEMSFGRYMQALVQIFSEGAFGSHYGGPMWATVADTLRAMVFGETTPEMFLDTVWALRHNTAPIFNKGMLFANDKPDLNLILDVQRSGQIPFLIDDAMRGDVSLSGLTAEVKSLHTLCANALGWTPGYVDYVRVKECGAITQWPHQLEKQMQKWGTPASMKAAVELESKKFWVTATEYAVKIEREAA